MNIGIITSHMNFEEHGGAPISRHVLGQQLEQRGHHATIYTLNFSEPENHVPGGHDYDLVKTQIDSRTIFDGVAKFFGKIGEYFENNDIVHCYVPGIIPLVGLYKRVTGDDTPVCATLNGYTPFCTSTATMADGCWKNCSLTKKMLHAHQGPSGNFTPNGVPRMAFNQYATIPLMNEFDRYFCLSPAVRTIYRDVGVNEELLDVVPNMIDPTFAYAKQEKAEEPPVAADGGDRDEGVTRLLYVGRVDAMKSIGNLIEAAAKMQTDDWHLDIVGDNILDYGQSLNDYIEDGEALGVDDKITWHGWVDNDKLSPYYAQADVMIHPAEWPEPFGRTIIEAMEHGVPVVASQVGAPPWIIGSAGITYPRDDPQSLAETLDGLVKAPERVHAMSANTELELERFQPDRVMGMIESRYQEVLEA